MAFKRSNKMNLQQQRAMDSLLEIISTSNEPVLQSVADDMYIRKTMTGAFDSQESEQQQFDPSDSEQKNISSAQSHYDSEKTRLRNMGTNGNSFDKNLSKVMSESRHATPLSDVNASRAKDFSSFSKHPDQPSIRSSSVFDSFAHGARQGRG